MFVCVPDSALAAFYRLTFRFADQARPANRGYPKGLTKLSYMEPHKTAGSYALALFALLWLGMILGCDLLPPRYTFDLSSAWKGGENVVTSVGPGAARAGLRVGDVLLLDRVDEARQYGTAGSVVPIRIRRGAHTIGAAVPLTSALVSGSLPERIASDVAITFALLLASYLAYRRPGAMTFALILFLGGGALSWPEFVSLLSALPNWLYVPFATLMEVLCDWFPVMALASFAVRLPGGALSTRQQRSTRVIDTIVIAAFGADLFLNTAAHGNWSIAFTAISGILVLVASVAALVSARPVDRGRAGIVFAGVMIGGVGYAINMIGLRLGEPIWLFTIYVNISIVVVPLSLAYAILRHRVFDVGFVLNRTIVFGLTSALVVVLFAALEFVAERFLSDATRVESVLVQFGVALTVIVSVRLLHRRVDVVVDNVLFRARHEQESALRRFASTLQFYTEEQPLLRDTFDVLLRHGRVNGAAIYIAQDKALRQVQSSFPVAAVDIDHNDMAYVELRAHHEPLLVHAVPTTLPGDRLYPMVRAGRIVGVIATGERESGEEMPPDIDDAIMRIAQAAATELGAIESDRIRSELTTLRTHLGFS